MAKPKAPRWLTESFRDGVDERYACEEVECWLSRFSVQPCEGRFERFHFLGRQRVENAMWTLLANTTYIDGEGLIQNVWDWDLILLAAWDSRNGGIACEAHHRRFDSHLVPPPSQQFSVAYEDLPEHVLEFSEDWGLEDELQSKFEAFKPEVAA